MLWGIFLNKRAFWSFLVGVLVALFAMYPVEVALAVAVCFLFLLWLGWRWWRQRHG